LLDDHDRSGRRLLLKQPDVFARDPLAGTGKTLAQKYWFLPAFMSPLFESMLGRDGDDHDRLRQLVEKAFQKTAIDELRPRIAAIADDLLGQIDTTQPAEIIATYTRVLPLMVICDLLGIPQSERAKVARWIAPLSGPTSAIGMLRGLPGLRRIMRYFRKDFERVRRAQRPGLITNLVEAENEGDKLNDDEFLAMVVTLFIAGHETMVHLISIGIYAVLSTPATRQAMQDNPAELPLLVEELMRFYSPVMMTKPHIVQEDVDLDGVPLAKGDQIAALLIAANHDEARFKVPETFIVNRRPNPHVCLGCNWRGPRPKWP
jgi:cytochrome P450